MEHNVENLDAGQLDAMYNMIRMGHQKANIPALKDLCDQLRQCMIQKTGGQEKYGKPHEIDIANDLGTITNCIVIETMCLYLSGQLDRLEDMQTAQWEYVEGAAHPYRCGNCWVHSEIASNYCPHCGKVMAWDTEESK